MRHARSTLYVTLQCASVLLTEVTAITARERVRKQGDKASAIRLDPVTIQYELGKILREHHNKRGVRSRRVARRRRPARRTRTAAPR